MAHYSMIGAIQKSELTYFKGGCQVIYFED